MKKKKKYWQKQKTKDPRKVRQARSGDWYMNHTLDKRMMLDDYRDEKESENVK